MGDGGWGLGNSHGSLELVVTVTQPPVRVFRRGQEGCGVETDRFRHQLA